MVTMTECHAVDYASFFGIINSDGLDLVAGLIDGDDY